MLSYPSPQAFQPDEDDQLMIRLQDGDQQAFNEIALAWQERLQRFFDRNTHDAAAAEDLAQETLLRLYRSFWDYIPRGMFRGFLFRIAQNLLIDQSRREKTDVLLHARKRPQATEGSDDYINSIPDVSRSAEATAEQHELHDILGGLLHKLPEDQRMTFILYYYQSLSLPEIACATSTGLSTVKSRLRLAREKLRTMLIALGFNHDWELADDIDNNHN